MRGIHPMPDLIVTDADREAAAHWLGVPGAAAMILAREWDDHSLVQAFARYRTSLFATISRPADAEVEGLVERVAKALHGRFYVVVTGTDDCHDWPYMPEELRESYRQGAREVIAILSSGPVAAETEHRLSGMKRAG
jgi:hypothetical protein